MYLVILAWGYVVVMMTLAELTSSHGTVLGAFFILLLYGVGPMALLLYLMGAPLRRKAQQRQQAAQPSASGTPDGSAESAAGAEGRRVPPVGKKP